MKQQGGDYRVIKWGHEASFDGSSLSSCDASTNTIAVAPDGIAILEGRRRCLCEERDTWSMSREDVQLVSRLFSEGGRELQSFLLGGGDLMSHPWMSLWHPEAVLEELAEIPDAGIYEGREAIAGFFERAFLEVWDEWQFVPSEIIDGPEGVFVAVENSGRTRTGVQARMEIFQVLRIRNGMIVYATAYLDRQQALKEVGLAR